MMRQRQQLLSLRKIAVAVPVEEESCNPAQGAG